MRNFIKYYQGDEIKLK